MDSREFTYWRAMLDRMDPTGDDRTDYHAAQIVQAVIASSGVKPGPVEDHLLRFEPPKQLSKADVAKKVNRTMQALAAGQPVKR